MICPKCQMELITYFFDCPHCGLQLKSDSGTSQLAALFGRVETGGSIHLHAQYRLMLLGRELSFVSQLEFEVQDLVKEGRRSFIDVVWSHLEKVVAAFEIKPKKTDVSVLTTHKDILKLQNFNAREKFIVNVSELTGMACFFKVTPLTSPRPKSYSKFSALRARYPRAYETWTEQEDVELQDQYGEGLPLMSLAKLHQRQPEAIQSRLVRLGLALDSESQAEPKGQ